MLFRGWSGIGEPWGNPPAAPNEVRKGVMEDDDKWAEIHGRLSAALEAAFENGWTDEEIEECIENARPSSASPVPTGKLKPKPFKR